MYSTWSRCSGDEATRSSVRSGNTSVRQCAAGTVAATSRLNTSDILPAHRGIERDRERQVDEIVNQREK